jgi:hypothetical protein
MNPDSKKKMEPDTPKLTMQDQEVYMSQETRPVAVNAAEAPARTKRQTTLSHSLRR